MIKYKVIIGETTTELEYQTIGELIEYLNYGKERMELSKEPLVWDNRVVGLKDSPSFFVRPGQTVHFLKTEVINGELWYVNDGQQPVGDDVRVDIKYKNNTINYKLYGNSVNYDKDYAGPYKVTHWRLAK